MITRASPPDVHMDSTQRKPRFWSPEIILFAWVLGAFAVYMLQFEAIIRVILGQVFSW